MRRIARTNPNKISTGFFYKSILLTTMKRNIGEFYRYGEDMNELNYYYQNEFREHVREFMRHQEIPGWFRLCESNICESTVPEAKRAYFIICLFITVLIDQAMATYLKEEYKYLEKMTLYPKFGPGGIGCPHIKPYNLVVEACNIGLVSEKDILSLLSASMRLLIPETISFFSKYVRSKSPGIFFLDMLRDRDIAISDKSLKRQPNLARRIKYESYQALYKAVRIEWPFMFS